MKRKQENTQRGKWPVKRSRRNKFSYLAALNAEDKAGLKIKTLAVKLIAPCYPRNEYIRRKCAGANNEAARTTGALTEKTRRFR